MKVYPTKINYTYTNKNNVKVNLHITNNCEWIENQNKVIQEFIEQLESGKIQIFENTYSGDLYACDNYIFNTRYEYNNLQFVCTYGENDKILQCDIIFDLNDTKKIHYFNKDTDNKIKQLLNAI